jgi:hypothetical protein
LADTRDGVDLGPTWPDAESSPRHRFRCAGIASVVAVVIVVIAGCGGGADDAATTMASSTTTTSTASTTATTAEESSTTTAPAPSGCTETDMARDLGVPSVGGVECVEDWALAGVCAEPDPLDCVDTTRLLHLQDGRWGDAGFSLQTCIEELTQQGVPEAIALQFEGFSACSSPAPSSTTAPPSTGASAATDCGPLNSEYGAGTRIVALGGISCARATAVIAAYFAAPDKQGSSGYADVEGFSCYSDALTDPSPGDVTGGCTGPEGTIEIRIS